MPQFEKPQRRGSGAERLRNLLHRKRIGLGIIGGTTATTVPDDTVIDSVSMTPYLLDTNPANPRDWVLTEITFGLVPSRAIRNDRYKLIWRNDEQEFYDLDSDPHELNALDLSSLSGVEQDNYTELSVIVEQLLRRSL